MLGGALSLMSATDLLKGSDPQPPYDPSNNVLFLKDSRKKLQYQSPSPHPDIEEKLA